MMYGSLLYNLWAALFSFSVYFVWALQQHLPLPVTTIVSSFIAAIIVFIAMYPFRYILGYIFYTPHQVTFNEAQGEGFSSTDETAKYGQFGRPEKHSTVEFQDESTEEIAQVVRKMLHGQDEAVSK
ncbi:multidrug transporter [Solibacillus sp. FSL H8-0538]|uniref:multidrug transporter n=1 Tax=Solibacillus sp. FSL H8-0538 TaxID=2921400 RepID=UPI0030F84093